MQVQICKMQEKCTNFLLEDTLQKQQLYKISTR